MLSTRTLAERLAAAAIELNDLAAEFGALAQSLTHAPEHAATLQEKMDAWHDAKRRYGGEVRAVAAAREELRRRLGEATRPPQELDYLERLERRF